MAEKKKTKKRASQLTKAEKIRVGEIATEILSDLYPDAVSSLNSDGDPWRLLIMARLSAQCTDARVNEVARELFSRFPTPETLAEGELDEIERIIKPCGLYRVKAKNIRDESAMLIERFGGVMPNTMEEMLSFPGVGRKIANLILGDVNGIPGIVADTHCIRVCGRLGLYEESLRDPLRVEKILSEIIKPEEQSAFCHRIVLFGRDYCRARSPRCDECPLSFICAHAKAAKAAKAALAENKRNVSQQA
ncbi:MAG: endonuclease III [Eubacteriales bacterium]|jgi:endonuclease-3